MDVFLNLISGCLSISRIHTAYITVRIPPFEVLLKCLVSFQARQGEAVKRVFFLLKRLTGTVYLVQSDKHYVLQSSGVPLLATPEPDAL